MSCTTCEEDPGNIRSRIRCAHGKASRTRSEAPGTGNDPDSPTQRVGGKPAEGFPEFTHRVPMLSLDNSYSIDELRAFDERCRKLADGKSPEYVAELKIDGLSLSVHYEDGAVCQRCYPWRRFPGRGRLVERAHDSQCAAAIEPEGAERSRLRSRCAAKLISDGEFLSASMPSARNPARTTLCESTQRGLRHHPAARSFNNGQTPVGNVCL